MASNSSSSCSEPLSDNCPTVLVSNALMQLIKDPEETEKKTTPLSLFAHVTTMDELLMDVKNYIVKHKLYDPANPLKILVHEDELGSLLGKSEFSLLDVRDILLQKFVIPVTQKNSSEVISSISDKMSLSKKRKLDNTPSEFAVKRIKCFDDTSCESDESMHSCQDYETEFVKDSTSDDNFSVNGLIIAETFDVDVEYEIETMTDSNEFSCESDSDIEEIVKSAIITFIARSSDSDIEYLADGSSDETQSEQELSEEDKWRCLSCFTLNDPLMRCCAVCWRTRVGWLSERSERQKNERDIKKREGRRRALARSKRKLSRKFNKNKDSSNRNLSDLSSATTESLSSPSSSCNDSSDVIQSSSNALEADKGRTEIELDKQLCLFCCAKPADSSIIHGKVGCKVCCFKCGRKLFAENKRCPVCRRNIERIVYLYNS
ncbi:E3 ubiquitin-protein ligase Mdm2 like protein [Argiope bruennichi]|uniref:E3 ubiquitin-protein ligase Mdm2 like protein n=1 Tax=Argiope bruennichi TaxID=94029 RepID=A0A8T0F6J0_ARGBR|nr:E3 ubiquitin-protein ligase Mdm2 like protein [Argiope bruennichi]